jgi:hypothetical protein
MADIVLNIIGGVLVALSITYLYFKLKRFGRVDYNLRSELGYYYLAVAVVFAMPAVWLVVNGGTTGFFPFILYEDIKVPLLFVMGLCHIVGIWLLATIAGQKYNNRLDEINGEWRRVDSEIKDISHWLSDDYMKKANDKKKQQLREELRPLEHKKQLLEEQYKSLCK